MVWQPTRPWISERVLFGIRGGCELIAPAGILRGVAGDLVGAVVSAAGLACLLDIVVPERGRRDVWTWSHTRSSSN